MHVSIARLWWCSLAVIAVCFGGKLWAFKWWKINEVDAVIAVLMMWCVVWMCSVKK